MTVQMDSLFHYSGGVVAAVYDKTDDGDGTMGLLISTDFYFATWQSLSGSEFFGTPQKHDEHTPMEAVINE